MEVTNPPAMQMESVRRGGNVAEALEGPGRYENIILRTKSFRSRTQRTRSHGKGCSLCVIPLRSGIQNRSPRIPKTGERLAVSQAVRESSESFEVMMMQEIEGVQNLFEGRM